MVSLSQISRRFGRKAVDMLRSLGYDATVAKKKRKPPDGILRSEDAELTPDDRRKLLSGSRDLARNFSVAGWAIRKHLDYVSTFNFQSKSDDEVANALFESLMGEWSEKENCDVAGRHCLGKMVRLSEGRRTVDGDLLIVKILDGRLQAIEGDRIAVPLGGFNDKIPASITRRDFEHGVRCDDAGKALEFSVCRRSRGTEFTSGSQLQFERLVPAANCWHHGYFDRFDQVRGIAPLSPTINTLRDLYEGCEYALAKMKVSQLFGLVLNRQGNEGDPAGETDENGKKSVKFGEGPFLLDLNEGDQAKFLEAASPSTNFQDFAEIMISQALKGLDIPYSFYAENFTNFSGQRQAWLQYDYSARTKRGDNIWLLDRITRWKLEGWVLDGILPEEFLLQRPRVWRWNAIGVPWIDPLKEVQADLQALGAALISRTRICRDNGEDFEEIAREIARENEFLKKLGLPTVVTPSNVQITEIVPSAAA